MGALVTVVANAVALWVATLLVPGVWLDAAPDVPGVGSVFDRAVAFAVVGVVFGVVNLVVRPAAKLVSLPLYLLTLGLFAFVLNALMLELTSWLSGFTPVTLHIDHFFWSAVLGALVISFVSWALHLVLPKGD